MKAWVLHGINDLRLEEVPVPTPKEGEVLVRVKATGICTSDIPRIYGGNAYHYPVILGHEFSGVTEDGQRVGVFPLIPCRSCASCKAGHYETCACYSYIGSRRDGAYAQYVAVPRWNLIALPDHMTFEQAALLEPAAVALHAVKQITGHGISKAAVVGDGAIGQMIGMWLGRYAVQTVHVLGQNDKNPGEAYDVCFEAVGTTESFKRCIELVRPNGELILVGNPHADFMIDQKLYWQILRKQLVVSGIWNSGYPSDWQQVVENADSLELDRFISHKFGFYELGKALELVCEKREKHNKVMVVL